MKCKFCNTELPEGAKACSLCGTAVEQTYAPEDQNYEMNQNADGAAGQNMDGQYQQGQGQPHPNQAYSNQPYPNQPYQGGYGQPEKPVSSTPYMVFAILATLFCCLPLGIAAIVYASKINTAKNAGDYAGARAAAKKAKLFTIIGVVAGIILQIILISTNFIGKVVQERYDTGSYRTETYDDDDDFDITDDDDEKKAEVVPAKPSGELGANWDSYTVQINDKVLTLPCTIKELEDIGLAMDVENTPENYMVNAGEYTLSYFEDANENEIMVQLYNTKEEAVTAKECLIGGISADDYGLDEGGLAVIFPGGVQIGATKEEVLAVYGETDDVYEGDSLHMYTWYDENSYYKYCEIDFDAGSGKVTSMHLEAFE